jgi:hypothetical protein
MRVHVFIPSILIICLSALLDAVTVPRNSRLGRHRREVYFSPLNGAKKWLPMPSQSLLEISQSRHSYQHHKPKQVPTVGAFLFFDHPLASCEMCVRIRRNIAVLRHRMWDRKVPLFVCLAGDEASIITGQVFVSDGGRLAGQKASTDLLRRLYPAAPLSG